MNFEPSLNLAHVFQPSWQLPRLICEFLTRTFIWQFVNFDIKTVEINGSGHLFNRISQLGDVSVKGIRFIKLES